MDPDARNHLWKIIKKAKENGMTIILSSHSMDECEALCDTLGIMVNGQLQCIGKIPDLKKKYGEGYCLIIKLKISNQIDEEFKAFDKFIQENIHNSTLEGKILFFLDF